MESGSLMHLQIGMTVVDVFIDPNNDDLVISFDRAVFSYFCEYHFVPSSIDPKALAGATLVDIIVSGSLMSYKFSNGFMIEFALDECTNVEAYAGTITDRYGTVYHVSD